MGAYTTYDFTESLDRVGIHREQIEHVIAAWGEHGSCAEWEGGFLLKLKDGRHAYIWGWCDTTGWGCQDGAQVEYSDERPSLVVKRGTPQHIGGYLEVLGGGDPAKWQQDWDEDPADLNRYVETGEGGWD